jgi:hypothetical protein
LKFSIRSLLICVALFSIGGFVASRYFFPSPPKPLDISYGFSGISVYGVSDTHTFGAELDIADVSRLPNWDRRNPYHPVSINDAMLAAQEYRDQIVTARQFPAGSRIIEAKLTPFDSRNGVWFWTVRFRVEQVGNPIEDIEIAVLMDGSVVQHEIHRRIDTGWPLPDAQTPERPDVIDDIEILKQFVEGLNPTRKHAGLNIELTGVLTRIPSGHSDLNTGKHYHFTTDDGVVLACDPPGGWAVRVNQRLKIAGKLLGYRNLNNREQSWDGLQLLPGIKITSVGVVQD